jgi:hypothetical protein
LTRRKDLLSSTATLPERPRTIYERNVYASDLWPGVTYTATIPSEAPHTITFDGLKRAMDKADENRHNAIRRPFISMEDMQELSRQTMPLTGCSTWQFTSRQNYDALDEILFAKIEDDKRALRKLIDEAPDDFTRAWHEGEWRLLYGDGSGRPGGIFTDRLTSRRK